MSILYKNILNQIVTNTRKSSLHNYGPGLLTGKSGVALLLFYYSRLVNDKTYAKDAGDLIIDAFHSIKEGFNFPTFCDGLSGFAWTVEHLVQNGFISRKDVPFLDDLDEVLYKQMLKQIKNAEYDFLHGAIGIGVYFLDRAEETKKCIEYLDELIYELDRQSITNKNGSIKWECVTDLENGAIGCNIGLAHGMASIIAFLAKYVEFVNNQKKALVLLNGAVKYVLSQRLDVIKHGMNFPNVVFNDNLLTKNRKIGWCHGDTGIAIALYNAGKVTKNVAWQNIAISVMSDSAKIRNLKLDNFKDPGLCHGSIGIAHMFNWFYNETKNKIFKEASAFWLNETLKKQKFKKSIEDFEKWFPGESNYKQEYSLLVGVTGIGLSLISVLSNEFKWDRCLLIS